MTVAELRSLLKELPDDMPVLLYQRSCGEWGPDEEPLVGGVVSGEREFVLHIYDDEL